MFMPLRFQKKLRYGYGTGWTYCTDDLFLNIASPAVIGLGLDLGTHNLRAAVFRVELIKDERGNDCTPAFVGFNLQSESADNLARSTHRL